MILLQGHRKTHSVPEHLWQPSIPGVHVGPPGLVEPGLRKGLEAGRLKRCHGELGHLCGFYHDFDHEFEDFSWK